MIEFIQTTFIQPLHLFAETVSGGNMIAKGAIVIGAIGLGSRFVYKLPYLVKTFMRRKFMVSVEIHDKGNASLYRHLSSIIAEHCKTKNFFIEYAPSTSNIAKQHGAANGKGWMFYKNKFYFFVRSEITANKKEGEVELSKSIKLFTFGNSPKVFFDIYGDSKSAFFPDEKLYYLDKHSGPKSGYWLKGKPREKAPYLAVNKAVKDKILKAVEFFNNNKDWYEKRGLAKKLVIVLYGPPGTGKTSLSRFIADETERHLASINVGNITDVDFSNDIKALSDSNALVSIQDFDANPAFHRRDSGKGHILNSEATNVINQNAIGSQQGLNISSVLNTLQGDVPLDDVVIVMTTNHIEKIDPAILRKGRVDLLIEVGALHFDEVKEFWEFYYETTEPLPESFKSIEIVAADLMGKFQENPFDKEGFLKALQPFIK